MENQSGQIQENTLMTNQMGGQDKFEMLSSLDLPEGNFPSGTSKEVVVKSIIGDNSNEKNKEEEGSKEALLTESPEKKEEVKEAQGILKAIFGDKEIDVPEEAVFTIKVDGKEETVPLKELQRQYQGKVPWEKHYRELKEERKKFDEDVKLVDSRISKILELVSTEPIEAVKQLAILAGKNPAEILGPEAFLTKEELEALDDSQKQAVRVKKYHEYEKEKIEGERKKLNDEKSQIENQKYLESKQREYQITDEELNRASQVIEDAKVDLSKKTIKEIIDFTVDYVVNIDRKYSKVEAIVSSVEPARKTDVDLIKEISNLISSDFTDDDIREIVEAVLDKPTKEEKPLDKEEEEEEDLEGEVKKSVSAKPTKDSIKGTPKKATPPKIPQKKVSQETEDDDPISFDDLVRPYRNR